MPDFLAAFHESVLAPRAPLIALVERVMETQASGLERVTKGYVNEVYRADFTSAPSVFVRIRRRGGVSFASEAWAIEAARRAYVPVPVVHAVTVLEGEETLEVMILEAVPGRPLGEVWPDLTGASRQQVMGQVGEALRLLHSTPVAGWGRRREDGWEYPDWASRAAEAVQGREADLPVLQSAGLTAAETAGLMDIVRELPRLEPPRPVLCHGDLGLDHLFVDEDLRLTGVIDFGNWQGGLWELDVAMLRMYHPDVELAWLEPGFQGGAFDEGFEKRVLTEQVNTAMGFLAHDLRRGNADYLEAALAGLRGMLGASAAKD